MSSGALTGLPFFPYFDRVFRRRHIAQQVQYGRNTFSARLNGSDVKCFTESKVIGSNDYLPFHFLPLFFSDWFVVFRRFPGKLLSNLREGCRTPGTKDVSPS